MKVYIIHKSITIYRCVVCTLSSVIIIVIIKCIKTVVHCDPVFSITIYGADASLGGSTVALNKFAQYALAATIALLTL